MRTALTLSVFESRGDGLVASAEREDLRPEQVMALLKTPPSDDPDLHAGEYEVRDDGIAQACALFGMEPVEGEYFIGTVSL